MVKNNKYKLIDDLIKDYTNCEGSDCFGAPVEITRLNNLQGVKFLNVTGDALYYNAHIINNMELIEIAFMGQGGEEDFFNSIIPTFKFTK